MLIVLSYVPLKILKEFDVLLMKTYTKGPTELLYLETAELLQLAVDLQVANFLLQLTEQ